MSNEKYRVIHKHSMVTIDGLPKLPTSGSVEYGEIAINYAKSAETLSIRNSENEIVTFSSDDKFNESFRVMSKAMCDLDDRVTILEEMSAITVGDVIYTESDLENVSTSGKVVDALLIKDINNDIDSIEASAGTFNTRITNLETSATSIDTRVTNLETSAGTLDTRLSNLEASAITTDDVVDTVSDFSALTVSGKVVDAKVVKDVIVQNERITSAALNDLNEKIIELSGATPSLETTIAVSGTSAITVTVGEETSNALVVPYATSAETIVGTIMTIGEFSGLTETGKYVDAKVLKDVIKDNEEITSAAINDLNERIIELSGATPTIDLISTEEEFSGLTVSGKVADALVLKNVIEDNEEVVANALIDINDKINELSGATPSLETTLAVSGTSAITVTVGEETSNALVVPYAVSAATITKTVTTEAELSALTETGSYVDAKLIRDIIYDNEEVTSQALNYLNGKVNDLSGETENIIQKIENNDIAIAGALNDFNDKTTELNDKTNGLEASINTFNSKISILETITRMVRKTSFDLNVLKQAVAEQNLEKYGLKVGDETTINGYTYVIAGLNPMYGPSTPYRVNVPHVGLIVIPHTTQAWNIAGNTYTGANGRGAGYKNCDLHYYLKNTTLPHVQNDLGSGNLIAHTKLLSSDVNTTGYNRYGTNTGCASAWAWEDNCYISALSEIQVYGSIVWSSAGFDTGEACRQLDVFRVYNMNEIFKGEYPWLRDIASASNAAYVSNDGVARSTEAYNAYLAVYVAALILFH